MEGYKEVKSTYLISSSSAVLAYRVVGQFDLQRTRLVVQAVAQIQTFPGILRAQDWFLSVWRSRTPTFQ